MSAPNRIIEAGAVPEAPVTVICYSCGRDEFLLPMSLGSVRVHAPTAPIHVFSDRKDPLGAAASLGTELGGAVTVGLLQDGVTHGQDLRGLDYIAAAVVATWELLEGNGHEWALKIDSDVIWHHNRILQPVGAPPGCWFAGTYFGRVSATWPYASGGAYFIHKHGLEAMGAPCGFATVKKFFVELDIMRGGSYSRNWGEDHNISGGVALVAARFNHHNPEAEVKPWVDFSTDPNGFKVWTFNQNDDFWNSADFVEYGQRHMLKGGTQDERRANQAEVMAKAWSDGSGDVNLD